MLLTFSVRNFRSFKEEQTLDLRATKETPAYSWLVNNVQGDEKGKRALKSKAIYGANASGKSNLIRALFVWQALATSDGSIAAPTMAIDAFTLSAKTREEPSTFVGVFEQGGSTYEYGLEATQTAVLREWLFDVTVRRAKVFERNLQDISVSDRFFDADDRLTFLRQEESPVFNRSKSFLSAVRILKVSQRVVEISDGITSILCLPEMHQLYGPIHSLEQLYKQDYLLQVTNKMLKDLDIAIDSFRVFDKNQLDEVKGLAGIEELSRRAKDRYFGVAFRSLDGEADRYIPWLSEQHESAGTNKLISLAPLIISTLHSGGTLILDEFESQLHTRLAREIVQLFNSTTGNPNNAQFIFSTHDTNLLDNKLLRRDQIALVEKNKEGASEIYSLSDVKGVRKDANFEKEYLGGSYGAVPTVRDLDVAMEAVPDGE